MGVVKKVTLYVCRTHFATEIAVDKYKASELCGIKHTEITVLIKINLCPKLICVGYDRSIVH